MSRRQTLGPISPNALHSRQSLAPGGGNGKGGGGGGGKPEGGGGHLSTGAALAATGAVGGGAARQSVKPPAPSMGRPSMAPRPLLDHHHRASGAGGGGGFNGGGALERRSSAFGKAGGQAARADPRPLTDKAFFGGCVRAIIAYASAHGYPYALSPKILSSPTGKDFAQLATWLFGRFDPTMKQLQGKVEDEVPLFFRRLAYPFALSKSALFAVGSPHSWPAVLAALAWLVELLTYDDRAEEAAAAALQGSGGANGDGDGSAQFDDAHRGDRQFFAYACAAYRFFLAGDDARAAAVDEEMLGQFRERHDALADANAALSATADALEQEVDALRREPSPLAAARAAKAEVLADQAKFREVIAGGTAQQQQLQRKLEERAADLEAKRAALAAVRADNEALAARVAGQAVSRADANRMAAERTKQRGLLDAARAQREAQQRRLGQAEAALDAVLGALEERLRAYHAACHRLGLLPASAKRAGGVAYECVLNRAAGSTGSTAAGSTSASASGSGSASASGPPPHELLLGGADLKGAVRPGLLALRERYRLRGRELAEDALALREQLDAAREANHERGEELAALRRQAEAAELRHRQLRQHLDADVAQIAGRAERMRGEVSSLRNALQSRVQEAEQRLRAAKAELEAATRRAAQEAEEVNCAVVAAANLLLQHASSMRAGISDLAAAVDGVVADVHAAEALVPQVA